MKRHPNQTKAVNTLPFRAERPSSEPGCRSLLGKLRGKATKEEVERVRVRTYQCVECGHKERLVFSDKAIMPDAIDCRKCGTGAMMRLPANPANHFKPTKKKEVVD